MKPIKAKKLLDLYAEWVKAGRPRRKHALDN